MDSARSGDIAFQRSGIKQVHRLPESHLQSLPGKYTDQVGLGETAQTPGGGLGQHRITGPSRRGSVRHLSKDVAQLTRKLDGGFRPDMD